jgi:hypothetical protein
MTTLKEQIIAWAKSDERINKYYPSPADCVSLRGLLAYLETLDWEPSYNKADCDGKDCTFRRYETVAEIERLKEKIQEWEEAYHTLYASLQPTTVYVSGCPPDAEDGVLTCSNDDGDCYKPDECEVCEIKETEQHTFARQERKIRNLQNRMDAIENIVAEYEAEQQKAKQGTTNYEFHPHCC